MEAEKRRKESKEISFSLFSCFFLRSFSFLSLSFFIELKYYRWHFSRRRASYSDVLNRDKGIITVVGANCIDYICQQHLYMCLNGTHLAGSQSLVVWVRFVHVFTERKQKNICIFLQRIWTMAGMGQKSGKRKIEELSRLTHACCLTWAATNSGCMLPDGCRAIVSRYLVEWMKI